LPAVRWDFASHVFVNQILFNCQYLAQELLITKCEVFNLSLLFIGKFAEQKLCNGAFAKVS
jgi:hypothetical protein